MDVRPLPGVDLVAKMEAMPLPDGTADYVLARHCLEHLPIALVPVALAEWHRVLAHGGTLEVVVPDAAALARLPAEQFERGWLDFAGRLGGAQDYPENTHLSHFCTELFPDMLRQAGFAVASCETHYDQGWPEIRAVARRVPIAGRRLLIYDQGTGTDPWTQACGIGFQRLGWHVQRCYPSHPSSLRTWLEHWGTLLDSYKPDALLVLHAAWIGGPPVSLMEVAESVGVVRVSLCHDEPYRYDGLDDRARREGRHYDLWYSNWGKADFLAAHTARRAIYLPCGALDVFVNRPALPGSDRTVPLGFVGVYYAPREKYLTRVADLGLRCWLQHRRTPDRLAWPPPPAVMRHTKEVGWLNRTEIAAINLRTAVALDIAEQPDGRVRCAKNRLFETMAQGVFTLAGKCRDTMALFRDGRDLVLYESPADLREKAAYYVAHEDEREEIAANGRAAILAGHTFMHRLAVISAGIDAELVKRGRPRLPAPDPAAPLPKAWVIAPKHLAADRRPGRAAPSEVTDSEADARRRARRGF